MTRAAPMGQDCVEIPGYGRATRLAPRWYVGYLTFRGGNPMRRLEDGTGGGFIPPNFPVSTFLPQNKDYASRQGSVVGSGSIIADPFGLSALLTRSTGPDNQI